ncbi:MAG: hypothetical protein GY822_11855 [Deltaproteobacteria bacterium]|nr:hypothetical protein [Deltaproteobacteria bacterium]
MAQKWIEYRAAREKERFEEAKNPGSSWQQLRIEQADIDNGCYSLDLLVNVGRTIFTHQYRIEDGYGNNLAGRDDQAGTKPRPNARRFQKGAFGGPDASSCLNCHWKQGLIGSGDRADNSFLFGDGDDVTTHDARNPPMLWGAGWTQLVGEELTRDLHAQRQLFLDECVDMQEEEVRRTSLNAQGIFFGHLKVSKRHGQLNVDTTELEGVDADLVVKPFGWKGVFPELRDFVMHSLQVHLGMQAEEAVALVDDGTITDLDLGNQGGDDPDGDGVVRELTEGQITALQLFLATLDFPVVDVPEPEDFALRWAEGASLFDGIGCASCHRPFLAVRDATYRAFPHFSGSTVSISLDDAARPIPSRDDEELYQVPVFSDFKRHAMGDRLPAQYAERGVPADTYMTRRLSAVVQTGPWMHSAAATYDEAIYLHGGEESEAKGASEAFFSLPTTEKGALRIFLDSLRRAPSIRIR